MIVEIFDDLVKGKLPQDKGEHENAFDDLRPLFDKLDIPLPHMDVSISRTVERGYNLFLNPFGAVLRLYPYSKKGVHDYDEDGEVSETRYLGPLYHPSCIPVIGTVRFDDFALQIVPGVEHAKSSEARLFLFDALFQRDISLSFMAQAEENFGLINGKTVILDNIAYVNFDDYEKFNKRKWWQLNSLLNRTLKANGLFENLQKSFYDCWIGQMPFKEFWQEMRQAKESGLLLDGWNSSHIDMNFPKKGGDLVEIARNYEEQLNGYDV